MLTTRYILDESHLKYYDEKLKSWASSQPVKTLPSTLYPWTLTDKAGAVSCWPVGGTQLKPTVDFLFSETGPAEGTKGPDNPSTIAGVSSITVARCETVGVAKTQYAVDLGSTYYGGSIDLATGVMTVTHVAVTPDASTVDISSAPAALPLDYADTYGRTITSADGTSLVVGSTGGTVVYKLATPQTVQLTPVQISALAQADKFTPRINTVYSDQSAVQVGYVKSPIREEFELQQAIVAQGGNV